MPNSRHLSCFLFLPLCLASLPNAQAAMAPIRREWMIDGVTREVLIFAPPAPRTKAAPVVFAFHGHGGLMDEAVRTFAFQTNWPEAIVVYMQGVNTPGRWGDPEGERTGWQFAIDEGDERDLKFFDAVLAALHEEYHVDDKRVYATGHSNGGYFDYLLWATRGEKFAAFAPVAATADPQILAKLKPKPVLHLAGEKDETVKFTWQRRTIEDLRKLNECGEGQPWNSESWCTLYPSKRGTPVVSCLHPGGHEYPPRATAIIVKFFQEHALP